MGERWRDLLQAPQADQVFLVAEMDGVVTSYARGGPYRVPSDADPADDVSAWCEIYAIYTHPDQLGRGGGSAVHDAMIETLGGFGHRVAYLWAADHDRHSYAWFGRRGWRPDGTTTIWMGVGEPLPETRLVHDLTPAPHV
jgi:GNAT superfamily N-acetyltransferase